MQKGFIVLLEMTMEFEITLSFTISLISSSRLSDPARVLNDL
jgi:hypothetical protein